VSDLVASIEPLPENIELESTDFGFKSELYQEAILELGKQRTRKAVGKDFYIIQAVKGLDDLTHTANLLSERLHEWYGLHWPELEKIIKETEYINLISELGDRDTIVKKAKIEKLKKADPSDSVGIVFDKDDLDAVMSFAQQLKSVHNSKLNLENYLKNVMEDVAPNVSYLTGPIIGARLISLTGGLSRLSKVSSSTIQLLGAEKALFRHLRDGERPPKHGIIFQHVMIHNAPYWQRGKIARAFAGKLAIAAKVDQNSNKFMGDDLENVLKQRVDDIKKKYPKAPLKIKRQPRAFGRGEGKGKFGKKKRTKRGKRGKGKKYKKSKK